MPQSTEYELIPDDFLFWSRSRLDRHRIIARAGGISLIFTPLGAGWWEVTKIKGGQVLRSEISRLRPRIEKLVLAT